MDVRNNPNVTDIQTTFIGSPVLVYRHEKDKWIVPFSLCDIHDYDCIVLLSYPAGPSRLRSTVVKPFVKDTPTTENNGNTTGNTRSVCPNLVTTFHGTKLVRVFLSTFSSNALEFDEDFISAWKTVLQQSGDHEFYAAARSAEFNGLIEKGVFTLVRKSQGASYHIYGFRFCEHIKNAGIAKSSMVIQSFKDNLHGLLTHSPTVQRSSQQLLLAIHRVVKNFVIFLRDVTQT